MLKVVARIDHDSQLFGRQNPAKPQRQLCTADTTAQGQIAL
jgi:hypothetical protein